MRLVRTEIEHRLAVSGSSRTDDVGASLMRELCRN
jgi:hypothetical protein